MKSQEREFTAANANRDLETELDESWDSIATLSDALMTRQHLLIAEVEEVFEKFEAGLS
jgi:hypothetical protein